MTIASPTFHAGEIEAQRQAGVEAIAASIGGFIRAETTAYDDLMSAGSLAAAKAASKVRLGGKGYEVQDGDILEIRFSV